MTHTLSTQRRSEQGFTLVELAIVMVIIGLLIAGILKGQELIANARLSATVSQVKGLDAAINTFQDKYNSLPGDMLAPNTRLTQCTQAPCTTAGNGDGVYANQAGAAPTNAQEGTVAFAHLSAADLVSGIDISTNPNPPRVGGLIPAVRAGGAMWIGQSTAAGVGTGGINTLLGNRTYAALNGAAAAVGAATGAFTPTIAAQIDRKIDDGIGNTGSAQSVCSVGLAAATGVYNESIANGVCAMYVRVLN